MNDGAIAYLRLRCASWLQLDGDEGMLLERQLQQPSFYATLTCQSKRRGIMQTELNRPYKSGQWIWLGTALGAFVGLLVGKFALGLIFGFFIGVAVDSTKRKAALAAKAQGVSEPESS